MFFFKKKKLIEIDNKIEYLIEQLEKQNNKLSEVSDDICKLSNRVMKVEKEIRLQFDKQRSELDNTIVVSEKNINSEINRIEVQLSNVDKSIHAISLNVVSELQKRIEVFQNEIQRNGNFIVEKQKSALEKMSEDLICEIKDIKEQIVTESRASGANLKSIDENLCQRIDMLDSALKLLLLNSVMDQIDEE